MTIEPNGYKILKNENAKLKHEIDKQKNYNMSHAQRISELKKANEKLQDENEHLKERNYKLATINDDLYIDKYINEKENNQLKQELFNLYLKHYN